ncbi:MAG: PA14 domain-containing protein, partial [Planctomycetes bacterium]|nr:PA14 domain-containing protein [Planctomycetota bacterium]
VHRFNPRTFEVEFHFPIGPNPHGDVFDQWGYQFASDGTSGTGSYINIGKGIGNKQWYKKRVRPVPAIGILSSSHFPDELQGNFLICNAIGFLGVLQHEVKYNGADITAEEIDPILVSSDQNFRPSDLEVGGDGALYVADWHNALIGHMQHNMRDPNRDHEHGRIYRVTYKDRPLLQPAKMKGRSIAEVCDHFLAKENGTRYRARLELSSREAKDIESEVTAWAKQRDVSNPADAQALLECLWAFEEHRVPNGELLNVVFQAEEPRVRAAAIRTLGHWGDDVAAWQKLLTAAGRDESALVRAEAVKSAVSFQNLAAAEIIFDVATRPTDPELDTVLKYAKSRINVDAIVQDAINSGQQLSPAAEAYALNNAPVPTLLKMKRTASLYETILNRPGVPAKELRSSLDGLAEMRKQSPAALLVEMIREQDKEKASDAVSGLGQLLASLSPAELKTVRESLEQLALAAQSPVVRRYGYAAWIAADGSGNAALFAASKSKQSLRELIAAIPLVTDQRIRGTLYKDVRSLMFELPPNLQKEEFAGVLQPGIRVDFFYPSPNNVAIETLDKLTPKASGIVPEIVMNVPQKTQNDKFALRFTGYLQIPRSGEYAFYTASDDGSRLYIGDELVVNNDGLHGMKEKKGSV